MNKLMAARFVVPAFATAVLTTHAIALDLKYRCPVEGQFEAPPLIFGGIPNPSGGWQLWLEGTPQKMELTPLRGHGDGWRFACYIDVGGAAVELTASIGGERKCQLIPNGGVLGTASDGVQICMHGKANDAETLRSRCVVVCA